MISDLSRLVGCQLSNRNGKCFLCDRCLHFLWSQQKLDIHEVECAQKNICKVNLPDYSYCILKFKNYKKRERVPVIINGDCESLLKPRENEDPERYVHSHHLLSVGFYVKYSSEIKNAAAVSQYKSYRQSDENLKPAEEWFIDELKAIVENLGRIYKNIIPMELSEQQMLEFETATECYICHEKFTRSNIKVKDHSHLSGKYVIHLKKYVYKQFKLLIFPNDLSGIEARQIRAVT